ncbi:hypothetical protein Micbo1qcDRAFT_231336 [Microdochium bolleyi]|uniref:LITAF domain-containing protein n=1 Tax=Microdochium bolleyi TaxID=196109 RepID=A0A136J8Y9_9PEZI|nr:hypothetical protein Micbo1qcDRAFT_231336 [Microdochium bolleyi]
MEPPRGDSVRSTGTQEAPPIYTPRPPPDGRTQPAELACPPQPLAPVDDGGFPEVVVEHEPTIEIKPDIDWRKIHQQQPGSTKPPTLPRRQVVIQNESQSRHTGSNTITPLHLLSDQPDTIDCPFCQRRSVTRVEKKASVATHTAATALFFATLGGAVVPYAKNWKSHVSHFCNNCDCKVAERRYGQGTMQPLGTPEHLREVSRYPAAA